MGNAIARILGSPGLWIAAILGISAYNCVDRIADALTPPLPIQPSQPQPYRFEFIQLKDDVLGRPRGIVFDRSTGAWQSEFLFDVKKPTEDASP